MSYQKFILVFVWCTLSLFSQQCRAETIYMVSELLDPDFIAENLAAQTTVKARQAFLEEIFATIKAWHYDDTRGGKLDSDGQPLSPEELAHESRLFRDNKEKLQARTVIAFRDYLNQKQYRFRSYDALRTQFSTMFYALHALDLSFDPEIRNALIEMFNSPSVLRKRKIPGVFQSSAIEQYIPTASVKLASRGFGLWSDTVARDLTPLADVRKKVLRAIADGSRPDNSGLKEVIPFLNDKDQSIRETAAQGLGLNFHQIQKEDKPVLNEMLRNFPAAYKALMTVFSLSYLTRERWKDSLDLDHEVDRQLEEILEKARTEAALSGTFGVGVNSKRLPVVLERSGQPAEPEILRRWSLGAGSSAVLLSPLLSVGAALLGMRVFPESILTGLGTAVVAGRVVAPIAWNSAKVTLDSQPLAYANAKTGKAVKHLLNGTPYTLGGAPDLYYPTFAHLTLDEKDRVTDVRVNLASFNSELGNSAGLHIRDNVGLEDLTPVGTCRVYLESLRK